MSSSRASTACQSSSSGAGQQRGTGLLGRRPAGSADGDGFEGCDGAPGRHGSAGPARMADRPGCGGPVDFAGDGGLRGAAGAEASLVEVVGHRVANVGHEVYLPRV
ncbi:hypothetical protein [Streptomyces sp. WMMC940]|uniref:hypothetical protein n=1 Tax=Streptomyces sp. WMMC940 TaxID=3015153 RepID=UPI0022B73573|nr:hypothetical protein [Streptomyces sp. WMMC940]MCZ7456569.1 hypothetical protein [Streptomyces sp. WMMC940]